MKAIGMHVLVWSVLAAHSAQAAESHYAESVAMTAHAEDAQTTFDVRVARFPHLNRGTLWMYAFIDGRQYSLVDEGVRLLHTNRTDVAADDAEFAVSGQAGAALRGVRRYDAAMQGRLLANGKLHVSSHPQPGTGSVPVRIDATFQAAHQPINVRAGRIEVMGRISGSIDIDGKRYALDLPGKWHEQVGERPAFAPAFTYLFVQGEGRGLMATSHARGAWGYLFREGVTVAVTGLEIDAYGARERTFRVTLDNGERIVGRARLVREVSVPIEGRRRPGATVVAALELGPMVGVLNDWNPD